MTTTAIPRKLRRGLPIDPAAFPVVTKDLTQTEIGALVLLASAWWPTGILAERPCDLGRILGIQSQQAKAIWARLRPMFAPGAYFPTLRAAHIAKAERRARAGRKGMAVRHRNSAVLSLQH